MIDGIPNGDQLERGSPPTLGRFDHENCMIATNITPRVLENAGDPWHEQQAISELRRWCVIGDAFPEAPQPFPAISTTAIDDELELMMADSG